MELRDLVSALLGYDALRARALVQSAQRTSLVWSALPRPIGMSAVELALAASITELLAARAGASPPAWAESVPASPTKIFLVRAAETMRRLRATCESEGPAALRKRQFFAPPDFLTLA